ncbi:MAG: prolipoprotein diacylglyceryl transferase family protein [Actinomycetes bacterium]
MVVSFDIFGVPVQSFGIFFALNFIAWGLVLSKRFGETGRTRDWAWEVVLVALVGGMVGARLYWLAANPSALSDDPIGSLFSGSGLTWFGGLAGGVLAVWAWARWRKVPAVELLDIAGPCLALGYAIGRIGCQISGDGDYGTASSLPWAMGYPDGTVPTPAGLTVHPAPIYETLVMGIVAICLWNLRGRLKPGSLFALWAVVAGTERLLIEMIRRNDEWVVGLTQPQVWSLLLIVGGLAWLVVNSRGGLKTGQPSSA